jgi:hypothetical protein
MKEICNLFYCRICNNISKIQSNFTKSKKLICNNCENIFYYELLFCKICNKSTYCTKLDSNTEANHNTNSDYNRYICICNEIYTIENREIYQSNCCLIS